MRFLTIALAMLAFSAPAFAANCADKVKAAFEKQREEKMYRIVTQQPSAEGPVDMTVDYILPDKMLQTVQSPSMPGDQQTMLVGGRAFAGSGGGFEELLPQFSQSIIAEFRQSTTSSLDNLGDYKCLGEVEFEGQVYLGYRLIDPSSKDKPAEEIVARTIYVDTKTGLPAFNVVSGNSGEGEPIMKLAYSYPNDIEIIAPANAPVQSRP